MTSNNEFEHDPRATGVAVFAAAFGVFYGLCDVWRWPLFSYYPATGRLVWGYAVETADDGPAMYWYGWIATSALGAAALGGLAALLPENIRTKFPAALAWLVPALVYSSQHNAKAPKSDKVLTSGHMRRLMAGFLAHFGIKMAKPQIDISGVDIAIERTTQR